MSIVQPVAARGARARPLRRLGRARHRGAVARRRERATSWRRAAPSLDAIAANLDALGAGDAARVHRADALRVHRQRSEPHAYDVAFADPPYDNGLARRGRRALARDARSPTSSASSTGSTSGCRRGGEHAAVRRHRHHLLLAPTLTPRALRFARQPSILPACRIHASPSTRAASTPSRAGTRISCTAAWSSSTRSSSPSPRTRPRRRCSPSTSGSTLIRASIGERDAHRGALVRRAARGFRARASARRCSSAACAR